MISKRYAHAAGPDRRPETDDDRQTDRHTTTDRKTDRQADRETDRQTTTDRQTERKTDDMPWS